MKKSLNLWQLVGFICTGVAGVLLHFLFEWTGESVFVAPFSAVNESIWEHMKLLYFPMFLFALVENRYLKHDGFWCTKLFGIALGTALIPILYNTINGIFGPMSDWVNIAIFFVSAAAAFVTETKRLSANSMNCTCSGAALIILCLIALLFAVLTFIPPHIPLFQDPITGGYGI